jgi:hypothetical protein
VASGAIAFEHEVVAIADGDGDALAVSEDGCDD